MESSLSSMQRIRQECGVPVRKGISIFRFWVGTRPRVPRIPDFLALVGAPCFSRGSWTSVQRKAFHFSKMGFRVSLRTPEFGKSEGRTADPSATLRSGRDDNSSWKLYLAFPDKIVIPTGAYPDFLPHGTRQGRVCALP